LLRAVAVEGAAALAGRQHIVRIAELARAQERPDARGMPLELVAFRAVLELQLVEVDHVLQGFGFSNAKTPRSPSARDPLIRGSAKRAALTGRPLRKQCPGYQ